MNIENCPRVSLGSADRRRSVVQYPHSIVRWSCRAAAVIALNLVINHAQAQQSAPLVTPPVVRTKVDAVYPVAPEVKRDPADVLLFVTVDSDGSVSDVVVANSGGAAFDEAAVAAAKQWTFVPAHRGEEAISSRIRVPFHFEVPQLQEKAASDALAPQAGPASTSAGWPAKPAETGTTLAPAKPPSAGAFRNDARVEKTAASIDVTVTGQTRPPNRGASDYRLELGRLAAVPRQNAAELLKLAPGILLTNEGGEGHAEQVFLRGFDAREGQDIEFSVDGVPINESGNLHGNGYSDTHFIIPELVESLRVVEGPYDPRQGNYAVAGSADYHLALSQRGITGKYSMGSHGSRRVLLMIGPPGESRHTFAAGELYQTEGFGMNRDGQRGSFMGQFEGTTSSTTQYRITATAYASSFHTAGVLRDDDYHAGRIGFYDTYDPRQGEDSARYLLSGLLETRKDDFVAQNQMFLIYRPFRIRENWTGFLLDTQEPLQQLHSQRGDLLDLHNSAYTLGVRGFARYSKRVASQTQELEVGYFARGDIVSSMQQRIEAATGHPYHTDTNLDSRLGDLGLYADAGLRFTRWLSIRGGVRQDLFSFDVNDACAVQAVERPLPSNPPGDSSCLTQQTNGAYRDPNQRATTVSTATMPRSTLLIGAFQGVSASLSIGKGIRSIDPIYISQDAKTPFAGVDSYDAGVSFRRQLTGDVELALRTVLFHTAVDKDLVFSQTAGRNVIGGSTTRVGSANSVRVTGPFYDVATNLTWARATFDDTHLLIPYVPDFVFRFDSAVHRELPWLQDYLHNRPPRVTLALGSTYVGPRPLPYGVRSDTIFTLDAHASVAWRFVTFGVSVQNLLDTRYRLGEYNYASDFHSAGFPTLVPVRHFSAGAPRIVMFSLAFNYGDRQ